MESGVLTLEDLLILVTFNGLGLVEHLLSEILEASKDRSEADREGGASLPSSLTGARLMDLLGAFRMGVLEAEELGVMDFMRLILRSWLER